MIPVSQFIDGVVNFAVNDVVAVMPNSPTKFLALMAVGSARANPDALMGPYRPVMAQLGILTGDYSMVDEVALRAALDGAFSSMPQVTWAGFTFTATDAEKLYRRIGI